MATKVVMEALSPTMEEGRLVKWNKNEGDTVAKGDVLAEVETDKAVMELVARGEGILRKRLLEEGATAPVGQTIAVIGTADEDIAAIVASAGAPAGAAPATPTSPAAVVAGTQESAGATSVPRTVSESQGEASIPPQQRASEAPRAPAAPPPPPPPGPARAPTPTRPAPRGNGGRVRSSPLARRLAAERGLALDELQGTGPGGRIIRRDIEAALRAAPPAAAAPAPAVRPTAPRGGPDFQDVPLTQIRKTIARRLSESIGPIPTFYLTRTVDLTRVSEMRDALIASDPALKVSYNDIILKATATALTRHPEVNAHWLGDKIRYFNRVHLGMAVAVEDGLITPVIFDANEKGLRHLAQEARELAQRARERRLKPEEYTGSTFSVSNLGMFGIEQFTAIINPPEVGILAIGAIEDRPVVIDGQVTVRRSLRLTMSCDHRVVDGATGARFLQTLVGMLENPLLLVF
jgi:pyruvate dehydrogenase E2 component (dihydrolipoamide acetyltransferase)